MRIASALCARRRRRCRTRPTAPRSDRLEPGSQGLGRRKPPVGAEVAAARAADRPSGCGRARVDGLDVAAVALGRPRVDHADGAEPCGQAVAVDRPRPVVREREVARATAAARPSSAGHPAPPRPRSRRRARGPGGARGRRASTTGAPRSCRRRRRRRRSRSGRRTRARPSGRRRPTGSGRGWRPGPGGAARSASRSTNTAPGMCPAVVVAAALGRGRRATSGRRRSAGRGRRCGSSGSRVRGGASLPRIRDVLLSSPAAPRRRPADAGRARPRPHRSGVAQW